MQETCWADWLSAIGTVAAVFVSVGLFAASQRDRRRSDSAQARNAALSVLPKFRDARRALKWTLDQIHSGCEPHRLGNDETGAFGIGFLRSSFATFETVLPVIGSLGVAAPATQQAFHLFRELRDDIDSYYDDDYPQDNVVGFKGEPWAVTQNMLKMTEAKMSLAVAQMLKLLESQAPRRK